MTCKMDDTKEKVVKKITLTREKAGCILDVDPNASLQHIKFAFKRTSYKIYPKNVDTNKEDLLMFELVSAAYKRLASGTNDDVYIEEDYPFKLFRKAFKEKRVITIQARNGTFIVLGDKDEGNVYSSEDDFDASQYSFVKSSRNTCSVASGNNTKSKAERNKLKKNKQKENKRNAKEDLRRQRNELKEEKRKALDNHIHTPAVSPKKQQHLLETATDCHHTSEDTSNSFSEDDSKCEIYHDEREKHTEVLKNCDIINGNEHHATDPSILEASRKSSKILENDSQHDKQEKVLHDKQEEQVRTLNHSEKADNVCRLDDKALSDRPDDVQEASGNMFPSEKPVEQLTMSKHSENANNVCPPDSAISSNTLERRVEDPHYKQKGQLKMSKHSKNTDNYPKNPRPNNTVPLNKVSPEKQKAPVRMSNQCDNVSNGHHLNMPKRPGSYTYTDHNTKVGVANSNNEFTQKNSKRPSEKSCPNQVDIRRCTEVNSGKAHRIKPTLDECHTAHKNDKPYKIFFRPMSKPHSTHCASMHSAPTHESTTANEECKSRDNEVVFHDTSSSSYRQLGLNRVGNHGKAHHSSETVRNLSLRGSDESEKGNYSGAIASFTAAINLDPSSSLLYTNRSYCYEKINDLRNALLDADRAIQHSPNWVKGHLHKGRVLAKMKRYSEADKVYELVLGLDESNIIAKYEQHEVRVELLVSKGYSRQKSTLAVERYPDVSSALENLLEGNLTELVTGDIYVSDDEEITHNESTSGGNDGELEVHEHYQYPIGCVSENFQRPTSNPHAENNDDSLVTGDSFPMAEDQVQHYSVWLGNITRRLKVDMLHRHFSKFGPIRNVRMHYEGKYAFVNYQYPESALLAVRGRGFIEISGMRIRISLGPGCKRPDFNKANVQRNT